MRTDLDRRMDESMAALTGAGGPLALGSVEIGGTTLPMIVTVPPSLPGYFAHYAAEHHDKTFLVSGDERLSFAAVYAEAERVARALIAAHGVRKGDRIGIAMRNSPSWIALYMGIIMAGGIATLLNGWWQSGELAAAITDVDCALVFADPPRAARLAEIHDLGATVIAIDDTPPLAIALAEVTAHSGAAIPLPALTGDDDATILFTSGSTGQSKGAISDHRAVVQAIYNYLAQALVALGIATADGVATDQQHATLLNVPLFHVTGEVPVFLQSFAMGRKLVLMPKWDAEAAMRLIEAEKVTYFVGVPLMRFEILTHPNRHKYDLSTVSDFAAGGAPRPVEHVRRIDAEMGGGAPLVGYGLTETNGIGCSNWRSNYLAKPSSTGRAQAPLVDLAILDDHHKPVAQGSRGEVAIRSVCNFREYWGRAQATRDAFTADRYFLTGDVGYLDEDGYLFIVDRKKDIIIRGGENISCQEVEAAIYEHPAIAEAAVFGLPDERFGEVPGAVVLLREGESMTTEDLCGFLFAHIAAFKVPQRIWFSDAPLPRLGTEKIDKVTLRAIYRTLA
ncbi:MAG: class I adenylate-forming enzyme family protein [Sphingomonas sp.]|uniref:class I adenylate-forming enzyme family protein n=1 Tax=Sphingomonas sp. TaxID=28214 RepID=UPI003564E288